VKIELAITERSWPLAKEFRISRGVRTSTEVLEISLSDGTFKGRAEAVPYAHYGETLDSVATQIRQAVKNFYPNFINTDLLQTMPAGAARNAVDCALWDLRAKQQQVPVHQLLGLKPFLGTITAQTLSINTPDIMAHEAGQLSESPLIKVKLSEHQSMERMRAVAQSAPNSRFIIDANEAWSIDQLKTYVSELIELRVALIEQPLAAGQDDALIGFHSLIPLCADESFHTSEDLDNVAKKYQYINIKLDKTGGLTEAVHVLSQAKEKSLGIMVGCMVGTSLSMSPAALIASYAEFVDLDGPTLLAKDMESGFEYQNGRIGALNLQLWGGA